jgi:hypothetical protein
MLFVNQNTSTQLPTWPSLNAHGIAAYASRYHGAMVRNVTMRPRKSMTRRIILCIACVIVMQTWALAGPVLLNKTVVIDGISARVTVWGGVNFSREGYAVGAHFHAF